MSKDAVHGSESPWFLNQQMPTYPVMGPLELLIRELVVVVVGGTDS